MSDSETISKLKSVLTKYFSPENLRNDIHLTQILAKQQFVTVDEILRLSLVRKTMDGADSSEAEQREMTLRAIREMGEMLTLYDNDQYVIPKIPQNRTTIILRDLPEDVKVEEIKTLLDNDQCKNYQEIRPDVNKTWFVTYETEEDCVRGATWVQLNAKLRGEKVRCRIKSEHKQGGYYGGTPVQGNPYAQPSPYYPSPQVPQMSPNNDPNFIKWLERNEGKPKSAKRTKTREEDSVDYDGIFKLINKQTFEMVVSRYQGSNADGPSKIQGHNKHKPILNKRPAKGFMTLEEIDI